MEIVVSNIAKKPRILNIFLKKITPLQVNILQKRNIVMSAHRMEKAVEDLKSNPYFEKYSKKIATLQETSPEEFLSRIEQRQQDKTKTKENEAAKERQFSALLKPKKDISEPAYQNSAQLDKIMKVELVQDKSAEEISSIWQQYHIQKEDVVAATIPAKDYDQLSARSSQFPVFLFPLPRSQGYEFIMLQFQGNTVHFTPLLYYQV